MASRLIVTRLSRRGASIRAPTCFLLSPTGRPHAIGAFIFWPPQLAGRCRRKKLVCDPAISKVRRNVAPSLGCRSPSTVTTARSPFAAGSTEIVAAWAVLPIVNVEANAYTATYQRMIRSPSRGACRLSNAYERVRRFARFPFVPCRAQPASCCAPTHR
jgi:hypothetical protein